MEATGHRIWDSMNEQCYNMGLGQNSVAMEAFEPSEFYLEDTNGFDLSSCDSRSNTHAILCTYSR